MTTIKLDMTITADAALAEHDALPPDAPRQVTEAYWRRYSRLKNDLRTPVSYVETSGKSGGSCLNTPPPAAPVQAPAQKPENMPLTQKPKPKPTAGASSSPPPPPEKRSNLCAKGRTSVIPAENRPAIHQRINRKLADMGWGAPGIGIPAPHGAIGKLQTLTGMTSSDYHHTIRSGGRIYPHVLKRLHEHLGIREEWLLTGEGDPLWAAVEGAHYEPKKKPVKAETLPVTPPPSGHPIADAPPILPRADLVVCFYCGWPNPVGLPCPERSESRAAKQKPAPGIMPRWLHDESRFNELITACERQLSPSGSQPEWLEELAELATRIARRRLQP